MTLEEALAALKAAQSKIDSLGLELKKHADEKNEAKTAELQKKLDAANGELDSLKGEVKRLQEKKDATSKADAERVDFGRRMAIVDGARVLHGAAWLADGKTPTVDVSATPRDQMIAALVSRDKDFKADGKSDDYVAARFDAEVERQKKADASNAGAMRGIGAPAPSGHITPGYLGDEMGQMVRMLDAKVLGHREGLKHAWRGDAIAQRAAETAEKEVLDGKRIVPRLAMQEFDARDLVERGIEWVKHFLPRSVIDNFTTMHGIRRDADPATAFFQRQLMHVMVTPYEFIYPPTLYASLFPVTYEVPTGARSYAFHQFDQLGAADIVDDYADDAPNAEIVGKELIGRIVPVRSEFSYSVQDIRSAMMAGLPLDAMKAKVARTIIERKCDALAAVGDTAHSFKGVANDTNATSVTAGAKAGGGTKWVTISTGVINATPDEILKDINTCYNAQMNATDGTIEPDTIIFGKAALGVINTLRLDTFNQTTVGEYLRSKLPWLKAVLYWPRLNTADSGAEMAILCARSDQYFRFVVPQEFEMFPPQPFNLAFKTPCHKRWAEPQMIQPKAFTYLKSLTA